MSVFLQVRHFRSLALPSVSCVTLTMAIPWREAGKEEEGDARGPEAEDPRMCSLQGQGRSKGSASFILESWAEPVRGNPAWPFHHTTFKIKVDAVPVELTIY